MPGTRCTVAVCYNSLLRTKKIGMDITYHLFPKIQPFRTIWIQKCGRIGIYNPDTCHICSCHFTENDYMPSRFNRKLNVPFKRKLKPTAIPSLFLTEPPPIDLGPRLKKRRKFQEINEHKTIFEFGTSRNEKKLMDLLETMDQSTEEELVTPKCQSIIVEYGAGRNEEKEKEDPDLLKTINGNTEKEVVLTSKFEYIGRVDQMNYEKFKQIESKEQYLSRISCEHFNTDQFIMNEKVNKSQEKNEKKLSTDLQCQSIVVKDFSVQTDSDYFLENYKKLTNKKESLENDLVKWINRYRKLMSYMKYLEAQVQRLSSYSSEA